MAERSSGAASVADISLAAAGGALLVVGFLWGRRLARRHTAVPESEHLAPAEPSAPPAAVPHTVEDTAPTRIMSSELERLAGVAVSHGEDDPAVDVFLSFVSTLDPPPDAATLKPAAERIGKVRLERALERPAEAGVGASRLLAAASFELPRQSGRRPGTVTVEYPVETGRRLPELFETLLHAIRGALSLLA